MAPALKVRSEEQEGIEVAFCPNCSKMYPMKNEKGEEQDLPGNCKRCTCPMDESRQKEFSEQQAALEVRGMKAAPRTTQLRSAVTKG